MERRSFLKSAAVLAPSVGFPGFALSQAASVAAEEQVHVVTSGEDRYGEKHSRGYSSILFKVMPKETNGGLFIIEHANLIKGGPPLHAHLEQEEWFYVVEGEVLFQVGDTQKHLWAGDSILGPRNVPHAFASVGAKPGRMLIAFTPAGKMEQFFRDTAIPNPPVQDAAFFARYKIKLVGPSPFA